MKQKIILVLIVPFLSLTGISAHQESYSNSLEASNDLTSANHTYSTADCQKELNPNKFRDNWFFSINGGAFFSIDDNGAAADFGKKIRPAGGLTLGKWFAPWMGFRLWGMYGQGFGQTKKMFMDHTYNWDMINGYGDVLLNLHNVFFRYKENRKFQLIALLGAGVEHNFAIDEEPWMKEYGLDTGKKTLFGFRGGLIGSFRLSEKFSLNVEASVNCVDDNYDGWVWDDKLDQHVNLLVGLEYRFKNHDGSHQFTYKRLNYKKYNEMNKQINEMRRLIETEKETDPIVSVVEDLNHTVYVIPFGQDVTVINKSQQEKISKTAELYKKNKGGRIFIIPGHKNDAETELYMWRALTIRAILTNEYDVPIERIVVKHDIKLAKSLSLGEDNVVVYYVK